jgi:hypothetical protein
MYVCFLTPDSLPEELRDFFRDYLTASLSAGVDLTQGHRWFFISEVLCQLIAPEFGLVASVLPASHQRPVYGCLARLLGVDSEVLAIASSEVAVALYGGEDGGEEDE